MRYLIYTTLLITFIISCSSQITQLKIIITNDNDSIYLNLDSLGITVDSLGNYIDSLGSSVVIGSLEQYGIDSVNNNSIRNRILF